MALDGRPVFEAGREDRAAENALGWSGVLECAPEEAEGGRWWAAVAPPPAPSSRRDETIPSSRLPTDGGEEGDTSNAERRDGCGAVPGAAPQPPKPPPDDIW